MSRVPLLPTTGSSQHFSIHFSKYYHRMYVLKVSRRNNKYGVGDRHLTHLDNPVQNGWDAHPKLATISDLILVFNEIALNPVDFPLPLLNVEYARFSSRFCGRDNIEMGGRGKENKDVQEWKKIWNRYSVSTLFARDCSAHQLWHALFVFPHYRS